MAADPEEAVRERNRPCPACDFPPFPPPRCRSRFVAAPAFAQGFNDAAAAGLAKLGIQTPPVESLTDEQVAQITNILALDATATS